MTDDAFAHPAPGETEASGAGESPAATPLDLRPVRYVLRVLDAFQLWTVTEVDATNTPGARGPRCLIFARSNFMRRVWKYPADWRSLDDLALAALSWCR